MKVHKSLSGSLNLSPIHLQLLCFLLPWSFRRTIYTSVFSQWKLSPKSKISRLSLVNSQRLTLKDYAQIKPLNYVGSMRSVYLDERATIGLVNLISGGFRLGKKPSFRGGHLRLGYSSSITSLHRIDCSGGFVLGSFSIIAGYFTQVLTHTIDIYACRQTYSPVRIRKYCFVGTRSTLLPGCSISSFSVIGACSLVLQDTKLSPFYLYAGIPVQIKKGLDMTYSFFNREDGYVV